MLAANGQGGFRNLLVGGDFYTNPWQRGTTPISATTATTATMTADRWFAYSSANTMTIAKKTSGADISAANGILASLQVNRPSGTDVTPICVGQVLPATETQNLLGKNAVFSFHGRQRLGDVERQRRGQRHHRVCDGGGFGDARHQYRRLRKIHHHRLHGCRGRFPGHPARQPPAS
jgi:hypothetical protein